jgi:serine/threonine protein kinase
MEPPFCLITLSIIAGNRGGPRGPGAPRTGGPAKPVSIDVPAIPLDELNKMTNNFSDKALIGEGSYGRVYNGTLSDGRPAVIKKLDPSASQESDSEFSAQVRALQFQPTETMMIYEATFPHHFNLVRLN